MRCNFTCRVRMNTGNENEEKPYGGKRKTLPFDLQMMCWGQESVSLHRRSPVATRALSFPAVGWGFARRLVNCSISGVWLFFSDSINLIIIAWKFQVTRVSGEWEYEHWLLRSKHPNRKPAVSKAEGRMWCWSWPWHRTVGKRCRYIQPFESAVYGCRRRIGIGCCRGDHGQQGSDPAVATELGAGWRWNGDRHRWRRDGCLVGEPSGLGRSERAMFVSAGVARVSRPYECKQHRRSQTTSGSFLPVERVSFPNLSDLELILWISFLTPVILLPVPDCLNVQRWSISVFLLAPLAYKVTSRRSIHGFWRILGCCSI